MKRFFLCLLLLFSLFAALTAQETVATTEAAAEEINEQYELFSWEPVAKAKQYGVTIEKYDSSKDIWTDFKEIKTKETQVEVLFTPGVYRVSISSYNLIGRKSKSSDWVQFKILEENIPYLNKNFLPVNPDWNIPVLFVDKSDKKEFSKTIDENSIYINNSKNVNSLYIDEDYELDLLLVKGHNIFSPKTEFYLVPKEEGFTKEFLNWCDDRKEVPLGIVSRNSKEYSVILTYEASLLRAGYYSLEVRNPGGNTDSIDILVLDNTVPQITPNKGFTIDEHYNVNSFSISKDSTYEFSIIGKGLNSTTDFYLEPTTGIYSYPFETSIPRETVDALVTGIYKQGGSSAQITFSCSTENLRTGYYNLVAKNWDGTTAKFLCLIKKSFDKDYTKDVKKLKTKFNKKTEYVDVTFQDSIFTSDKTYTLVSQYDEKIDSNNRVELRLEQSGKKLVGKLNPDQLTIAKYALMIEDAYSSSVIYCAIDNTLKIAMNKMNESTIEKTFFRPQGNNSQITLDADEAGSIQFFDNQIEMTKRMPFLFTNFKFDMSLLQDSSVILNLELDLLNFQFASFALGYEYQTGNGTVRNAAFSMLRLAIPSNYFSPFIGAGVGINLIVPDEGINDYNDAINMFKDKEQLYGIAQAGVILFTVLDVRYNLFYNDMFTDNPYFSQSFSFGFQFPLRAYKFKRKVLTRYAQITKPGILNGADFIDSASNVDEVEILQSASVGGFEGYEKLVDVTIDYTVQVIEENAFRNCSNLETVSFNSGYNQNENPLIIKANAFANDNKIDTIYLPARTQTVQPGAFANWTNGQNIILEWNPDDTTERNLIGLKNCPATVHYENGEVFKGSFATPLEDERNWVSINELNISNVSVYYLNKYALGMRIRGRGQKWYRKELNTWINQDSPKDVIDYLKSGDKITFKVQGDGNSYDFILTTEEGGYFYYRFKTKEDMLTTVEIPYKKMKKYSYSSQKKLDVNKIKMFCIMPMCKDEWNEVSFFDFEVTSK